MISRIQREEKVEQYNKKVNSFRNRLNEENEVREKSIQEK